MSGVWVPHVGSWDSVAHYGLRVVPVSYVHAQGASEEEGNREFRANIDGEGATDWVLVRVLESYALVGREVNAHMFRGGDE